MATGVRTGFIGLILCPASVLLPGVVFCVASGPVQGAGAPLAGSATDVLALGVRPLFPGCLCPGSCGLSFLFCPK